ncbi:hypothetical protein V2J09_024271 [Rumex salicifolius]
MPERRRISYILSSPSSHANMADNEEGEQTNSRGNEWEVVSLTASAYAAAPGPDGVESIDEDKNNNSDGRETESSQPLFMSGHFVFPPNEHENLPVEPESVEIQKEEKEAEWGFTGTLPEEGDLSEKKGGEKWSITGLSAPEVIHSIYDDKDNKLSVHGPDFDEDAALHGLNSATTEASSKFSTFSGATDMGGSMYGENIASSNLPSPSEVSLDPSDSPRSEDKADDSELPPEAWWKRQVSSLCAHAKETNTFWSIFIAAAVMGLVILGKQWQQERWQVLQQRWHVSVNAEKSGRMLGPLSRFKDIFIGQRAAHIRNGIAAER